MLFQHSPFQFVIFLISSAVLWDCTNCLRAVWPCWWTLSLLKTVATTDWPRKHWKECHSTAYSCFSNFFFFFFRWKLLNFCETPKFSIYDISSSQVKTDWNSDHSKLCFSSDSPTSRQRSWKGNDHYLVIFVTVTSDWETKRASR